MSSPLSKEQLAAKKKEREELLFLLAREDAIKKQGQALTGEEEQRKELLLKSHPEFKSMTPGLRQKMLNQLQQKPSEVRLTAIGDKSADISKIIQDYQAQFGREPKMGRDSSGKDTPGFEFTSKPEAEAFLKQQAAKGRQFAFQNPQSGEVFYSMGDQKLQIAKNMGEFRKAQSSAKSQPEAAEPEPDNTPRPR